MESRFKAAGHAVHPMLIVFPLGLLGTAAVFDGIRAATRKNRWAEVGHYMIGAGVVSGLLAAVPGTVDYFAIPAKTRAKRIGLLHGIGNVIVTGMFGASWLARRRTRGSRGPGPSHSPQEAPCSRWSPVGWAESLWNDSASASTKERT